MFTVVTGISVLTIVGAVVRRVVAGPRRQAVGAGVSDPGQESWRSLAGEVEGLRDEVAGLRRELDDAQNRLDFTERLLAQAKERGLLSAPKER